MKKYKDKIWLHKKYIDKNLSTTEIGKICGCSPPTIRNLLNIHGIATRTRAEGHMGKQQKNKPLGIRFDEKVDKNGINGCWIWTASLVNGYGTIKIDGKNKLAHVVSWGMTNGPVPEGYILHHKCKTKNCVNPAHLLLMTDFEHRSLHKQGENHPNAKTTEKVVSEIRADWETKEYTIKQLMAKYKKTRAIIYKIVKRISWKHV